MMFKRMKNQRGDTIVEVLIALSIISLVLAASYAITNRNVRASQDTQEHTQAQQVVQQQIERLRASSASGSLGVPFKCITGSGSALVPSNNDAACSFSADGSTGNCTEEPCYHVEIIRNGNGVYDVSATWSSLLQGGTSKVSMVYGI
jgi:prepilin-type N-terminal cleavage/methylation domain-containing protein